MRSPNLQLRVVLFMEVLHHREVLHPCLAQHLQLRQVPLFKVVLVQARSVRLQKQEAGLLSDRHRNSEELHLCLVQELLGDYQEECLRE